MTWKNAVKKLLFKWMFIFAMTLAIPICIGCMYVWYHVLYEPLNINEQGYTFIVVPGTNIRKIAYQLKQDNIIKSTRFLRWLTYVKRSGKKIHIGEYKLTKGATIATLLQDLVTGKVAQYPFTIVEGSRIDEILTNIRNNEKIKDTLLLEDAIVKLPKFLDINRSIEGAFLADTYYFTSGTTDVEILKRANQALQNRLNFLWKTKRQQTSLLDPYQALILASIIEKESHKKEEYRRISGVYHRRLEANMRLQADPTVIYAIYKLQEQGMDIKFNNRVYKKHLLLNSPYNTYRNHGLPPSPIAVPSNLAIEAALHPENHNYLYFVATKQGDHVFSTTLSEHNKRVQELRTSMKNIDISSNN